MSAFVTGATGLIGRRLLDRMGDDVVLTSRNVQKARASIKRGRVIGWDGTSALAKDALEGVDTVFHLAGEPVAEGRWTEEKKRRIEESRVLGTRAIVDAMRERAVRPKVFVCASAVGIYGSRGNEVLTEESAPGDSFLAKVCSAWEREAEKAEELGVRVVRVRTGIVLAREGGALAAMTPLFRTGLAGKLGDGKQYMPWIHVDDIVALFAFAAAQPRVRGALNGSAPEPVTNAEFTKAMGEALHRPTFMTAPAFAMRLALGEKAEIVLASQRAVPTAALALDFAFTHGALGAALHDLLDP